MICNYLDKITHNLIKHTNSNTNFTSVSIDELIMIAEEIRNEILVDIELYFCKYWRTYNDSWRKGIKFLWILLNYSGMKHLKKSERLSKLCPPCTCKTRINQCSSIFTSLYIHQVFWSFSCIWGRHQYYKGQRSKLVAVVPQLINHLILEFSSFSDCFISPFNFQVLYKIWIFQTSRFTKSWYNCIDYFMIYFRICFQFLIKIWHTNFIFWRISIDFAKLFKEDMKLL